MAEHALFTFAIKTNRGGDYTAGSYVQCYWDDVAEDIVVYLSSSFGATTGTLKTSGPSLGQEGVTLDVFVTNYFYSFCDGPDYVYFGYNTGVFPYAIKQELVDSFICAVSPPQCDLQIADTPIITSATGPATNDGSVTVSATSSNGTIKFALFDFNYATEGQESGLFSGLYPAEYTIYAKDAQGCSDTITFTVPSSEVYNLRYFMEWSDLHGKEFGAGFDHKIEIYKRGYVGVSEELLAAGEPFVYKLNADAEDKFHVIRASELRFKFASTVSFQYHEIFTEDERGYMVKHYLDSGSGYVLNWLGYISPFLYSEDYVNIAYYIEIIATDGLAALKDLNFVDDSGNNFRTILSGSRIINSILKKLSLNINFRSAINLYEENFVQTDSDDPLTQAFYDTTVYYDADGVPEKCSVVLENILKEFCAVIAQADGKWIIWRPEELISSFDYREFDTVPEYVSDSSIDPVISLAFPSVLNRLAWKDRSGVLNLLPSYGKFIVNQKLIPRASLLPSYSFEESDLTPFGPNGNFFAGWGISINSGGGVTWGLEVVDREASKGALFINFASSQFNEVSLFTLQSKMDWTANDTTTFKFSYLIDTPYQVPWVRLRYSLKIDNSYYTDRQLADFGLWDTDYPGFLEIYVEKYNEFQTFEKTFKVSLNGINDAGEDDLIELRFEIGNMYQADFDSITDLRAFDTSVYTSLADVRRSVHDGGTYRYYTLRQRRVSDVDDPPFTIIPNVTGGADGTWEQTHEFSNLQAISGVLVDDVIMMVNPNKQKAPETISYEVVTNPNNRRTLEVDIFHGDCPENITCAKYIYKNFIKRQNFASEYIPTLAWARDSVPESESIQNIILKTIIAQYSVSSRRLSGNLVGDVYLKPYSRVDDQLDSTRYLAQGFDQQGRLNEYNVDLYELKQADESNPDGAAFSETEFSTDFDI